jgi:hypothetical protein
MGTTHKSVHKESKNGNIFHERSANYYLPISSTNQSHGGRHTIQYLRKVKITILNIRIDITN